MTGSDRPQKQITSLQNWKDFRKRMAIVGSDGNRSNMTVKVFRQALLRWLLTLLSVSFPNARIKLPTSCPTTILQVTCPRKSFGLGLLSPTNSQWFSSSWNHKVTRRGLWGRHPSTLMLSTNSSVLAVKRCTSANPPSLVGNKIPFTWGYIKLLLFYESIK